MSKKTLKLLSIATIYLVLIFCFVVIASAKTTPTTVSFTPLVKDSGGILDTSSLSAYIATLFQFGVGMAGVLAVLMIIWGGVEYMTTEAFTGKSEARGRIQNALYGLLLALASYTILFTINPQIVDLNKNCMINPKACPSAGTSTIKSSNPKSITFTKDGQTYVVTPTETSDVQMDVSEIEKITNLPKTTGNTSSVEVEGTTYNITPISSIQIPKSDTSTITVNGVNYETTSLGNIETNTSSATVDGTTYVATPLIK